MIKTGGWLVGLIAVAMVLAGCAHEGGPESDLSTDERVEKAFLGLAADIEDPDGGRLSKLSGTFSGESGDGTLTMEWGKNDVQYMKASMGSPGFQIMIENWCAGERDFTQLGGNVYESRRDASEPCLEMGDSGDEEADMDVGPDMPSPEELATMPRESVTEKEDGTIVVVLRLEDGSLMTVTIDTKDRIKRIEGDQDGETVDISLHYDSRRTISLPEADRRTPVEVEGHTTFQGQEVSWVAEEIETVLPLSGFEVHVYDTESEDYAPHGQSPSYGEPVVAFPLEADEQSEDGYSFLFTDTDADGKLSVGDTWALTFPDGVEPFDYDVQLFDTWAGLPTEAQSMPAPGLVALLGVLMLGLIVSRRR